MNACLSWTWSPNCCWCNAGDFEFEGCFFRWKEHDTAELAWVSGILHVVYNAADAIESSDAKFAIAITQPFIHFPNNFYTNSSGTRNATKSDLPFVIFVSMVCQVKSPFLHSNWCNEDESEVSVDPPKTTRLVSHDTIWWSRSGSGRGGPKRRYCWLEVKWWQRWDAAYLESIH